MTADELVEEPMEVAKGSWMAYSLCGARVETRRVPEHIADKPLKLAKTEARVRRDV